MTVCILAGGKGKRIGSDKCFLTLKGKKFIDYTLEIAAETGLKVIVAAGQKNIDGIESVKDIKGEGPIAGLYSALLKNSRVLIFPCDMPFLTPEFLLFLRKESNQYDITVCRINGKIQPQVGVYSNNCLPYIEKKIENLQFDIHGLLDEKNLEFNIVEETEVKNFGNPERLFFNINTMEELNRAEEILK